MTNINNYQLMTVEDLAEYLRTSKGNIYNLVSKKSVPYLKMRGIGLRFDPKEIESWVLEKLNLSR